MRLYISKVQKYHVSSASVAKIYPLFMDDRHNRYCCSTLVLSGQVVEGAKYHVGTNPSIRYNLYVL